MNLSWNIIKALRPRQWIKNLSLFAGLVFSGQMLNANSFFTICAAFGIFCLASSATYLINDIFDLERDRAHPFKAKRPLASGALPVSVAVVVIIILVPLALNLAYILSMPFFLAVTFYLAMQLLYSGFIKTIILLDIMTIAAGFVLRIYAGIWAIDAHLNIWFLLCITSFALFIAIGKRRSELTLLHGAASKSRETLLHYPETLLDILTAMFANSTWLAYALFAFLQPPISANPYLTIYLTNIGITIGEAKYLMITVPIVIYGVMRYLYVIYEKKEGESPERVLLTDLPILIAILLWGATTVGILYFL